MKRLIMSITMLAGLILAGCASDDVAMYEEKTTTRTEISDVGYDKEITTARQDTIIEVDD